MLTDETLLVFLGFSISDTKDFTDSTDIVSVRPSRY